MDFNDSKEQAEFRAKCTDWLEENATRKSSIKKKKEEKELSLIHI